MADDFETLTPDDSAAPDTSEGLRRLGASLKGTFTQFRSDRRAAETQWLLNLRQFLGKYDPELEARMEPGTSRAYPKITRVKCTSMKSRLMALLFPGSEKNWGLAASPVPNLPAATLVTALADWRANNPGVQPTQADLDDLVLKTAEAVADRFERVIDDQLMDIDPYSSSDYETLCGKVVASAILYGPGIAKGPMAVTSTQAQYSVDAAGMVQVTEVQAFRPYFEFVNCWDYYPDMSATTFAQMNGEFQRHVYSRHQALRLADREDFDGDAIRLFVARNPNGNHQRYTYENDLKALGGQNENITSSAGKYEFIEYWGSAIGEKLRDAGLEGVTDAELKTDVRFTAWFIDDVVVKLARNPFPEGTQVYHQFIFEEDEVNLLGSGLPPIMRDSQLAISSSARMLIDNASVVCGPNLEVDLDLLVGSQADTSVKPRKVWFKENANGQRAVQSVSFDSHIPELLNMVRAFSDFADAETFVNPMTGGDIENVPGEALRTTGGASMVYGAASLPFRDIVRNFDRFTVSAIHSLVQWNNIFHPQRDQLAGDIRPIPRGATSLMAKEVRSYALDNLAATLTPEERIYIDEGALLRERLKVRDLPLADLLVSETEVKRRKDAAAQQATEQQQQMAQMFAAQLQNLQSDTLKQTTQAQKNLDAGDVAVFKALFDALQAGASPDELIAVAARVDAGRQGPPRQPAAAGASSVPASATGSPVRAVGG